ncbi:MAG: DUF4013 domain-containing protein [Patescibacteria group bacterium]
MTMSFEKSFGFVFKDPNWVKKLVIGTVFVLLTPFLIGIPFMSGYMIRIIRQRLQGKEGLPEWDDMGSLFVDGMKTLFIGLVYALPVVVVAFGLAILMFIVGEVDSDAGAFMGLLFLPFQGLSMLYSLFIILMHPHIYYVIATDAPLSQAFHVRKYFQVLKVEWSNVLIALLMVWLAGALAWFGIFVFIIGFFIALAYVNMVTGDVYGRLLQDWKSRGLLTA